MIETISSKEAEGIDAGAEAKWESQLTDEEDLLLM